MLLGASLTTLKPLGTLLSLIQTSIIIAFFLELQYICEIAILGIPRSLAASSLVMFLGYESSITGAGFRMRSTMPEGAEYSFIIGFVASLAAISGLTPNRYTSICPVVSA